MILWHPGLRKCLSLITQENLNGRYVPNITPRVLFRGVRYIIVLPRNHKRYIWQIHLTCRNTTTWHMSRPPWLLSLKAICPAGRWWLRLISRFLTYRLCHIGVLTSCLWRFVILPFCLCRQYGIFIGNHKTLTLLSPWGRWADRGRRRNLSRGATSNSPWYRRLDSNQHLWRIVLVRQHSRHRWNVHPLSYYDVKTGVVFCDLRDSIPHCRGRAKLAITRR